MISIQIRIVAPCGEGGACIRTRHLEGALGLGNKVLFPGLGDFLAL